MYVQETVRDCARLGLIDDLRNAVGSSRADEGAHALRAVRDLVYELAGAENRNLAVDVLVHATGLAEFGQRTLRHHAKKHGLSHEGFRKQVLATRHRLGLLPWSVSDDHAN